MELTEFLRARIAEDEDAARQSLIIHGSGTRFPHRHILDPKRALADCTARWRVVLLYAQFGGGGEVKQPQKTVLGFACRELAMPYADHPDFDPAWRQ